MSSASPSPFRVRSFRFQWPADLLTSWAMEMETLILGWYVLVETGSVLMLTVFGALQYSGTLLAPMLGVVGDRIGQRNLMFAVRAIYAGLATVLMALAFAHALNPLLVLVVAGINGIVRPADQGMRAALIADSMPAAQLTSAMGISRTTSDSARVAGALTGAGMLAALGMGPAYLLVAALYAGGLLFLLGVAGKRPLRHVVATAEDPDRFTPWRDLRAGLVYVWTTPHLLAAMWVAFLVNMTAFPLSSGLLPYVAKEVYHTDQTGLGYLAAGFSAGALLGSLTLSAASHLVRPGRAMIGFAVLWYLVLLGFAQTQSTTGGIVLLTLAGFVQSLSVVSLAVILVRTADERFRGRVMGVRMLAIYGLPVGLLSAGALIARLGFSVTATLSAGIGLLFTLAIAIRWRAHLWDLGAPANGR